MDEEIQRIINVTTPSGNYVIMRDSDFYRGIVCEC